MEFRTSYLSTKKIAPDVKMYKPEEFPPPRNTRILCLSKYGCLREGIWSDTFDCAWFPFPRKG